MTVFSHTLQRLGYSGLAPFFVAIFGSLMLGNDNGGVLGISLNWSLVFISYSALIASFMAGSLWGRALSVANQRQDSSRNISVLVWSNLLSMLSWASLGVWYQGYALLALLVLAAVYFGIFLIERVFLESKVIDPLSDSYLGLRRRLTAAVIILHVGAMGVFN
ncbi:MAG: DUF3429 domain-containing protein [Cellvibrionaceae bacterium]